MLNNKIDDRSWIIKTMRMMTGARSVDNIDFPTQCRVELLNNGSIFCHGHNIVQIAYHMDQGYFSLREKLQFFNGI